MKKTYPECKDDIDVGKSRRDQCGYGGLMGRYFQCAKGEGTGRMKLPTAKELTEYMLESLLCFRS